MGTTTYDGYLRLAQLLDLQGVRGGAEDSQEGVSEHFFIVLHQSTELWFKQMSKDLTLAATCLESEVDPELLSCSAELLRRATATFDLLTRHLTLLEGHLPHEHFSMFRGAVDGASGMQSSQFRDVSRLLGVRRADGGRLFGAFQTRLSRDGIALEMLFDGSGQVPATYRDIANELLHLGTGYYRWLVAHLTLVSNMIGNAQGTGGSSGVEFLLRRVELPFATLRSAATCPVARSTDPARAGIAPGRSTY